MRICHFTSTFLPRVGGVEMVVSNLASRQHDMGHEVLVLTPRIRGIDNSVIVPYRVVHYQRPSSKRYLTRQVLVRLLWEHAKRPFDILHCHSAYPHGYVTSTFSRFTGVPVIITPHGPTDIMRAERIRRSPKLENRLALGLRTAAGITAISNDIFEEILSIGGISESKVRIIPNGVNLEDFRDVEPYRADYPYIMAMGRMVPQKGFDRLLVSFARVAGQLRNLRLLMAGEGVNRRDYEALARKLGIADRVRFLGLVQGTEKIRLLKGARFFVCPSRFEPFGIVVLEAMAAGLPILANRVGGIPDILEEGVQGILTDPDSPEEMGLEIVTMNNSPDCLDRMGRAALEKAAQFDWSIINAMYLEVYEKGIESMNSLDSPFSENLTSDYRMAGENKEGVTP